LEGCRRSAGRIARSGAAGPSHRRGIRVYRLGSTRPDAGDGRFLSIDDGGDRRVIPRPALPAFPATKGWRDPDIPGPGWTTGTSLDPLVPLKGTERLLHIVRSCPALVPSPCFS
jgi:hypothetical protein